jgi:hypothetical protein
MIHSSAIPLISNTYIFIFYYRIMWYKTMYIIITLKIYSLFILWITIFMYLKCIPLKYNLFFTSANFINADISRILNLA